MLTNFPVHGVLNLFKVGKEIDFNFQLRDVFFSQRFESGVFSCCLYSHLGDVDTKFFILIKIANAASKLTIFLPGDEEWRLKFIKVAWVIGCAIIDCKPVF